MPKKAIYDVAGPIPLSRRTLLNLLLLALPDEEQLDFEVLADKRTATFKPYAAGGGQARTRDGMVPTMEFKGYVGFHPGDKLRHAKLIVPFEIGVDLCLIIGPRVRLRR